MTDSYQKAFFSKESFFRWEGFLFNVLLALYFAFLAPFLLSFTVENVKEPGRVIPWLGILLIAFSIAEVFALQQKMKFVNSALAEKGVTNGGGLVLWIFHMILSIVLAFSAAKAFGYDLADQNTDLPWWLFALGPVVVLKEIYLLAVLSGKPGPVESTSARPGRREFMADLFLLAFACLAYTAGWQTLAQGIDMEKHNTVMYAANCIAASLLFLVFCLPLRIPYLKEEMAQLSQGQGEIRFIISHLVLMVISVLQL